MDSKLDKYKYYLIVDLEATCCDKNSFPRYEMETIEIGAVMVENENLAVVDEFECFIRPVRNRTLTDFCTKLTSITQSQVDDAHEYPLAIKEFRRWLDKYSGYVFCSWGDYDRKQLIQDSEFHRVGYPLDVEHVNIKKMFSINQGLKKRLGMDGALAKAGLKLIGIHHRGIDDARNMARLMPYILGRKDV